MALAWPLDIAWHPSPFDEVIFCSRLCCMARILWCEYCPEIDDIYQFTSIRKNLNGNMLGHTYCLYLKMIAHDILWKLSNYHHLYIVKENKVFFVRREKKVSGDHLFFGHLSKCYHILFSVFRKFCINDGNAYFLDSRKASYVFE